MKTWFALLIALFAVTASAQTPSDELAVISATVLTHYDITQPYMSEVPVLLTDRTEKLAPPAPQHWPAEALEAYEKANGSELAIGDIQLPQNVTIADVTRYRTNHKGTVVFRVARPAFVDADHAYVRYDFVPGTQSPKAHYTTSLVELRKKGEEWVVVSGITGPIFR